MSGVCVFALFVFDKDCVFDPLHVLWLGLWVCNGWLSHCHCIAKKMQSFGMSAGWPKIRFVIANSRC